MQEVSVRSLLEMLVCDSGLGKFDASLARAAADAATSDTLAARDFQLISDLRAELTNLRTNVKALRVLFDAACDLTSVRDVEMVLHAIVRRGRQLVGADVCYLMLLDQNAQEVYIRVTDGMTSPLVSNVRLPIGVGLGGVVAQTGMPHWTSDYCVDKSFIHCVDNAVEEEQLTALLGVPLTADGRILGVLLVGERKVRSFSQDEIALLSSLAVHAAISMENAVLFQTAMEAMDELSETKAQMERSNKALQASDDLHAQLMTLLLEGHSLQELAAEVSLIVGSPVHICRSDSSSRASAELSILADEGSFALELDDAFFDHLDRVISEADDYNHSTVAVIADINTAIVPIIARDEKFGVIVCLSNSDICALQLHLLERAATVMALELLGELARDEVENRVREELLIEVLTASRLDRSSVLRRGRLLGIDLSASFSVIAVKPFAGEISSDLRAQLRMVAGEYDGLIAIRGDHAVLVLSATNSPDLAAELQRRLLGSHATIGVADPSTDIRRIANDADQARMCAHALSIMGRTGEAATVDQLGIYGVLISSLGQRRFAAWMHSLLDPIERYDSDHNAELLQTMTAYFDHDGRVASAAQSLAVHTNTFYQRLGRLDSLLRDCWRTGGRALELQLALHARRLSVRRAPMGATSVVTNQPGN